MATYYSRLERGKSNPSKPRFRSGEIWKRPPNRRAEAVRVVCGALQRAYGLPRLGNPPDPLDDLVYITISNKTGPLIANQTFMNLRTRFPNWNDVLRVPISTVRKILRPAGLSSVKSRQLRAALRSIKQEFGDCDLRQLGDFPPEKIETFLVGLSGVSKKVAKCIMMYTLGAQVLPVDVHVHRIARRLGWTARKRADQCHEELESLVPPKRRYAFHVDCVLHGRRICRPHEPLCTDCCVRRSCAYFEKNAQHR